MDALDESSSKRRWQLSYDLTTLDRLHQAKAQCTRVSSSTQPAHYSRTFPTYRGCCGRSVLSWASRIRSDPVHTRRRWARRAAKVRSLAASLTKWHWGASMKGDKRGFPLGVVARCAVEEMRVICGQYHEGSVCLSGWSLLQQFLLPAACMTGAQVALYMCPSITSSPLSPITSQQALLHTAKAQTFIHWSVAFKWASRRA